MDEKIFWWRILARGLFLTGAVLFLIYGLPWFFHLFAPFLLGIWLAYRLNPWVTALEGRLSWRRKWLVLWLLGGLALWVLAFLWLLIPAALGEIRGLATEWEPLLQKGLGVLGDFQQNLAQILQREPTDLGEEWLDTALVEVKLWIGDLGAGVIFSLGNLALKIPAFFVAFFVCLLATYFFTCDFPQLQEKMKKLTSKRWQWWAKELKTSTGLALMGYLKAQLILALGVCVIMLLGFWWMGLRFPLVLALVIALLDFIPMIGAGMVLLPWAGVALLSDHGSLSWKLLLIWVTTLLFRHLLEAKVVGKQTGLSPVLSLMSIYVGLQVAGIWGMIFAPIVLLVVLRFFDLGIFRGTWGDLCIFFQKWEKLFQK